MKYPLKIIGLGAVLATWHLICMQTNASELRSSKTIAIAITNNPSGLSEIDRKFVAIRGVSGATELAAAKLALTQSSNMKVQYFSQLLISDDEKMAHQFNNVALRIGGNAATYAPDPAIIKKLKRIKQVDFDQAYIGKIAVVSQRQAVEIFTLEANQGKNDELRAFAIRMLPVIRHHFKMGEQLIREIGDASERPQDHQEISATLVSWKGNFPTSR